MKFKMISIQFSNQNFRLYFCQEFLLETFINHMYIYDLSAFKRIIITSTIIKDLNPSSLDMIWNKKKVLGQLNLEFLQVFFLK